MRSFLQRNWFKIVICILALMVVSVFGYTTYKCSSTNKLPYYGSSEYTFAICTTGSGRTEHFYCGVISNDNYQRWINGDSGTIFIHLATDPDRGWRVNINSITTINNYGSTPDWLPMSFVGW